MTFALKGEVLNFKAIVSKFSMFYMSASLLRPWGVPSTGVPPSFIPIQHLFFEMVCVQTHTCTYLHMCLAWLGTA